MIKQQWYAILSSKEVKENQAISVKRMGERLAFWRDEGLQVHCIADRCAHRGASLGSGKVCSNHLQCPFHGFEYDAGGRVVKIPAIGNAKIGDNFKVDSYLVKEAYGFIWPWYGEVSDKPTLIPFFEELNNDFSYGEFHEM